MKNEAQTQVDLLKTGALQTAILNSANFSSIATDERGVIQIFNIGAERMLGYQAADVVNKVTPADISDPGEIVLRAKALSTELGTAIAPGFEALVFKASRGIEDIYELTYVRKDGSRLPAVVSVTALRDAAEAIIGYLLIGTDNTARKLVEAEQKRLDRALRETNLDLRAAKVEAERANMAKSDFLSSMSHELRSPLNAILGFAQLMDSESPPLTAGQKESTSQILQAGWYLLELINEVLDLTQIESGKLPLSLEPVSLDEVLADCRAMIEPQALKSGIRLEFAKSDVPLFASADRTRVKQVFVNLLSNAIKYNRVGGSVEVSSRPSPGDRVRVSFQDTGEGLTPDKLAQLFQPFNRLGQEAGAEEGTGIGLVVNKRLVELMGGSIGVESTVGVGSVFWIELNATRAIETDNAATSPSAAPLPDSGNGAHRRTVLYVEDNPANLMLVTKMLARRPNICLFSAKDGRSGVEMAQATRPDIILMDINLPGISGVTALSILTGDPSTAHIPVIAVSANAMPRDIEKGLEAGFFRYLTKPIKVTEFMDTLDLALEAASTRSDRAAHEEFS
ncbi:MAG: ATP-binding protein [Xanthomonadales bacterium]|nr:ATP-binding protein [Xanthomonadales bacterium]